MHTNLYLWVLLFACLDFWVKIQCHVSPWYTYRNCPLVSGEADSENVWNIWPLAGQIFLHYLQKNDFSPWSHKCIFLPLQNVFYYIRPKFPSRKDKNIAGTVWLIPGAFAKVSPPDIFLFPLQNHSRHGKKCSLCSATALEPMKPWMRGAGVLVLYVDSESCIWILQDLEVDPGWRKHEPRTWFCH